MSNPFSALVDEPIASPEQSSKQLPQTMSRETKHLEQTFGFTLNEMRAGEQGLVYLEDQAVAYNTDDLTVAILEHAIGDRLYLVTMETVACMSTISSNGKDSAVNDTAGECRVVWYLFKCFQTNWESNYEEIKQDVQAIILRNMCTALKAPDLYDGQNVFVQFIDILMQEHNGEVFFKEIYKAFKEEEGGSDAIRLPYLNLLKALHLNIAKMTIMTLNIKIFDILKLIISYEDLSLLLMEYSTARNTIGFEYSNTLLGALFTISILPKTNLGAYEFFQNPLDPASNIATENTLFSNSESVTNHIHSVFLTLLKSGTKVRSLVLAWIGKCLKANVNRGKLWSMHNTDGISNADYVSDGFMLNMGAVLMKFCMPFCEPAHQAKLLKVDPTYCAVTEAECEAKGVHLTNLQQETCLVPCEDTSEVRVTSSTYNFITECFFMAHKAIDLGFKVIGDKLVRLNQEMGRIERTYNETMAQNPNSPLVEQIKNRMASEMGRYLSMKAALSEPVMIEMMFHLISGTAYWFTQVIVNDFPADTKDYIPLVQKTLEFPLNESVPNTLKCIPEFLVENIVTYLVFLRRFNPKLFEMQGYTEMQPLLTSILIYMGSPQRMKNPHLRARLAEGLEALLPHHKDEPEALNTLGGYQREMLFNQHEHRMEIVRNLLEVFVGIEMTGQSVEFEQKFNYRRPMYIVMDYLWELQEHREIFTTLAEEAEANIEAVTPPLFLRFINLLMNDAVFLLDESLANMSKLKEMEQVRESGAWDRLPIAERSQNMNYIAHIGMIARFDNILGKETIKTIERLTSRIKIVFTHYTMVDRVAAMLNYFLLNLVGPNQRKFKVKDSKEYSFDPAGTVLDICKIYVNLKENNDFCLAVSQDGRSYKPSLFGLAQDVLIRIGGGSLIGELQELASKVSRLAEEHQVTEDAIADAPDHFLDPIMSTLMRDPVVLPSSKQTVDRSTIARHLLSDQTDPFNRSPLTMDQVIPNHELHSEIHAWLDQKKPSKS